MNKVELVNHAKLVNQVKFAVNRTKFELNRINLVNRARFDLNWVEFDAIRVIFEFGLR